MPALDTLEKWKAWASIASSLALPVVLAVVGYFVQKNLADEGLKKDYVQIAVGVLNQKPSEQDKDVRSWAISLLDKNSPVPFTPAARESLQKLPFNFYPDSWGNLMRSPTECAEILAKSRTEKLSPLEQRILLRCRAWSDPMLVQPPEPADHPMVVVPPPTR